MGSLKDQLKKLNKSLAEKDKIKPVSEYERSYFDIKTTSIGSPYLDSVGMKVPLGLLTLLTGWKSSGKSSLAMIAISQIQKEFPDKYVVYYDGEGTVSNSYMDRLGIDREKIIVIKDKQLETMLDRVELLIQSDDVSAVVIDSVKTFFSVVVEDKSAEDNTIGIEAKRFNARMPIIEGYCQSRDIALIVINQYRENPGKMMGDPRTLPGGHWQTYMAALWLDSTKKAVIKEGDVVVGNEVDIRIRKSKLGPFDEKKVFTTNFYYDGGFDAYDEYARLLIDKGVVVQKGAWITLPDVDNKVQGKNALADFLEDNPEYCKELLKKIE